MKIVHHPDPESLMSCSAGSMPEASAAVMVCHIQICPVCRKELAWLEHIGTALFESLPPAPVSRQAAVIAMRAGEALDDQYDVASDLRAGDVSLTRLQTLGCDLASIAWTQVSPGVWQHQIALKRHDTGDLRLTKVAPGQMLPEQRHRSSIIAMVLKGSYRDATGHYQAGDVADLGVNTEKTPIADPGEGCVCLIATDDRQ